jgi:flagellar basal-body rod protein FlgC
VVFNTTPMGDVGTAGVTVSQVTEDNTPGRRVLDPKHPQADAEGYVTYSNVNTVEEMVNMISASRSYQNNIEVMNTTKSLLMKTLQMGQGS